MGPVGVIRASCVQSSINSADGSHPPKSLRAREETENNVRVHLTTGNQTAAIAATFFNMDEEKANWAIFLFSLWLRKKKRSKQTGTSVIDQRFCDLIGQCAQQRSLAKCKMEKMYRVASGNGERRCQIKQDHTSAFALIRRK